MGLTDDVFVRARSSLYISADAFAVLYCLRAFAVRFVPLFRTDSCPQPTPSRYLFGLKTSIL